MKVDVEEITSFYIQENFVVFEISENPRVQSFLNLIGFQNRKTHLKSKPNKKGKNAFFQDQLSEPTFRFLRFRDFKISTLFEEKLTNYTLKQ